MKKIKIKKSAIDKNKSIDLLSQINLKIQNQ